MSTAEFESKTPAVADDPVSTAAINGGSKRKTVDAPTSPAKKIKLDDTTSADTTPPASTTAHVGYSALSAMPADEDELFSHYVEQLVTKRAIQEDTRSCILETAYPPFYTPPSPPAASDSAASAPAPPARLPAKTYPFALDPFQSQAIASLERHESVLVSAHTSAGKTVVAEYAIALALRDKQRVIYTSPIKALSNQKYRELAAEFGDVGLMTGDITINPSASCLVMTTEILRNMLYRGSEVVREVSTVIYDEIHYMRNKERGVVWEETIIMLPHSCAFVFLSATIPNASEFACWIAKLHAQPVNVVYTDYRPTPLQHYLFPTGSDGLHLVVDEKGVFREDNFQRALALLKDDTAAAAGGAGGAAGEAAAGGEGGAKKRKRKQPKKGETSDIHKIVKMCFPEHDTRVLTDAGFLFLSDIEERKEQVLYACYDTAKESIVYRPGRVVINATPPARWVEFTQADTRRLWDATSDDYGSTVAAGGAYANYLTLRTTPEHEMYVQLCRRSGADGEATYNARRAGGADLPPHKMAAAELAPGYQCECEAAGRVCTHGWPHYRLYTGAASGVESPADVISLSDRAGHSPVVALGLRTLDELNAFLTLFGYWLGDGTMYYEALACPSRCDAVSFKPWKARDRVFLDRLLARLHLVRGRDFTSNVREVRVKEPRWFRFFDDEFGIKYRKSPSYNGRQALLRQGMHSTPRGRRTPTPSSASAAVSTPASVTRSLRRESSASSTCDLTDSISHTFTPMKDEPPTDDDSDDDDEEEDNSDSGSDSDSDEDEDSPVKSVKWLPTWALHRLDKAQLRLLIEGLRQADGVSAISTAQLQSAAAGGDAMEGVHMISTSGVGFRDQLIHACLHAGYSAHFKLNTRAKSVRGYNSVPKDDLIYSEEKMKAALQVDPARQFRAVRSNYDNWWVCYNELVSELLPAQDVRFDGADCRLREKRAFREGWVAVHVYDGTLRRAATIRELARLLSCHYSAVNQAHKKGGKVKRVWRIFSAEQYDEQGSAPQIARRISTPPSDVYNKERDGRVWCVKVEHDDHLIFVQRVHRNANGIVTKVGRTTIVGNCLDRQYTPVIVFSFSKRECEQHAQSMARIDFSDDDERQLIATIFHNAIASLTTDDQQLPQVTSMLPILKRGIGIHHSGLLPILKEIVEILFQEGLLKCLFSTETFSMGLNMPAKTVVFTSVRKWDGTDFRVVTSGEYIQMSGRAGRRGLDERGVVICMLDEALDPATAKAMLKGESDVLTSSFHLGYNMLLNLLRVEDVNPVKLMARSFHQFQSTRKTPALTLAIEAKQTERDALGEQLAEAQQAESKDGQAVDVAEYVSLQGGAASLRDQLRALWCQPVYVRPFLNAGRLVRVRATVQGGAEWGWGAIVGYSRRERKKVAGRRRDDDDNDPTAYSIDVLLRASAASTAAAAAPSRSTPPPQPAGAEEGGEYVVVGVGLAAVEALSSIRIFLPKELKERSARKQVGASIKQVKAKLGADSIPTLSAVDDLKVKEAEQANALQAQLEEVQLRLAAHPLSSAAASVQRERLLTLHAQQSVLDGELVTLHEQRRLSCEDVVMAQQLVYMQGVLRRVGCTTASNVIDVKGRVAAEVSTCDELVASELMLQGVFLDLPVDVCVAVCSSLVMNDRYDEDELKKLSPQLRTAFQTVQTTARRMAEVQREARLDVDVEEYVSRFSPVLMDVVLEWCRGAKFSALMKLTSVFEGTVIRCMRRLEELLRQLGAASKSIGNVELEEKFMKGIELLKRDIVFAASLYL